MEFVDVVMKRRAVRRFEEAGVERDVIERIALLARRAPSAGSARSAPDRRLPNPNADARSRDCAARRSTRLTSDRGSRNAPHSSSRASPRRSITAATRNPTSSRTTAPRSTGRSLLVGRRRRNDAERHARSGQRRPRLGFVGTDEAGWMRSVDARHPGRVHRDRRHASRAPGARRPLTVAQARLGSVRGVPHWERWA